MTQAVSDRGINWKRKRFFYPVWAQNGFLAAGAAPSQQTSLGAGARAMTQRTGLNMTGLIYVAAADAFEFDTLVLYDVDLTKDIGVRVIWTSNAAAVGARTITWQVFYNINLLTAAFAGALAGAATGAVIQAATALDTPIVAEAPAGVNNALQVSNRGVILGRPTLAAVGPGLAYWMSWRIVMSAFNAAFVENKYLLGLLIDYDLRKTLGPGRLVQTRELLTPFDPAWKPAQT